MIKKLHFMRILTLLVLILVTIVSTACSLVVSGSNENKPKEVEAIIAKYPDLKSKKYSITTVKRVVDGDTFETKEGDKVRLIGMDTPETVKPGSPVEDYGKEASAFTKKELTGKEVIMFADVEDKDRYGRLLRYVFLKTSDTMFNEILVREGYANIATFPPNVTYADTFRKLEKEAREKKRGLWADPKQSGKK